MKKNRYILMGLALAVSVFVFDYYFLVPRSEETAEALETSYNAMLREERALAGSGITVDQAGALIDNMKETEARLIEEKSEFLASARLQQTVLESMEGAGLFVMTIKPSGSVKTGKYTAVSVYFEGAGNVKQLSDFFKGLEGEGLLLKTEKLNVTVANLQNPRELKFKIQVAGLAKL